MSAKQRPHYADAKGVITEGFDGNALICNGPTVPVDGTKGFAPGCLFFKRGGVAGACLYINEGTAAACDFDPFANQ